MTFIVHWVRQHIQVRYLLSCETLPFVLFVWYVLMTSTTLIVH